VSQEICVDTLRPAARQVFSETLDSDWYLSVFLKESFFMRVSISSPSQLFFILVLFSVCIPPLAA
jgi:hypothetical protein